MDEQEEIDNQIHDMEGEDEEEEGYDQHHQM
jgi:hypothetical protein